MSEVYLEPPDAQNWEGQAMYEIKNIEQVHFEEIARVHNQAFADYVTPMQTTPAQMEAYFRVAAVDRAQSFCAFYEGRIIGFLVNAVDSFRGQIVAYDAMTGIVPEHRGQGLFGQLFAATKDSLKQHGIRHYYLEVISTNTNAYNIYRKIGGVVERDLVFLCGTISPQSRRADAVEIAPLSSRTQGELALYQPAFASCLPALQRDRANYLVATAEVAGGSATVVYSKLGRVAQIRYRGPEDLPALQAVLTRLAADFRELKIANIPATETGLLEALLGLGFTVLVNQYEMCIAL